MTVHLVFSDILLECVWPLSGKYFAAASVFMGGAVKINPGPVFRFPPDDCLVTLVKPLCEVPPPEPIGLPGAPSVPLQ